MIRFLEIQGPNCRETLHPPLPKATLVCKNKKSRKNPKEKAHLHQNSLCHNESNRQIHGAFVPVRVLLPKTPSVLFVVGFVHGRPPFGNDFFACARHSCELMATNGQEAEKAQEMFTQLSQIKGAALSTWGNSDTWQKNLINVLRIFELFRKYCPAMILLLPVPWIELPFATLASAHMYDCFLHSHMLRWPVFGLVFFVFCDLIRLFCACLSLF